MCDIEKFRSRLKSFSSKHDDYDKDFNGFWKWKTGVESENDHILDNDYYEQTHGKLSQILRNWKAYRNSRNLYPYETLRNSLSNLAQVYHEIRKYTLLEFDKIPLRLLEKIWHELGRVKEDEGKENQSGVYYIIAVCKPLMLLWGQTLAFDTNVRFNCPNWCNIKSNEFRWTFNKWHTVMIKFSDYLHDNPRCIDFINKESENRYGRNALIPYGRLLDIYYFQGA